MRIGHGYDAHRFAAGRSLILGGANIDYELGMLAHSDGDVVIHALIDALLGAAGLGDIGGHFPDSSADFKDIDSRLLLQDVMKKLGDQGYCVGNADITIVAQVPKMKPYLSIMKSCLASDLLIDESRLNIKATTTEEMGFVGRKEGIATYAVVLLNEAHD